MERGGGRLRIATKDEGSMTEEGRKVEDGGEVDNERG